MNKINVKINQPLHFGVSTQKISMIAMHKY